jgi:y4mF family transcriptional regulator
VITVRSPSELGAALRAARKSLGLTQPDLALAAGVGVRFIVELEAGKATAQLQKTLQVIDAVGGRLTLDLFSDEKDPPSLRSGETSG